MAAHTTPHPNAALLESATEAFGHLFANDIKASKEQFSGKDDPFHLMGLGVCVFLEAVLGMEANVVTEASKQLALADTASKKWAKDAVSGKSKSKDYYSRFPAGMEWEIINADAIVLLGLTNALSESYMGYLQCMYALNNAHSKFTNRHVHPLPPSLPSPHAFPPLAHSRAPNAGSILSLPAFGLGGERNKANSSKKKKESDVVCMAWVETNGRTGSNGTTHLRSAFRFPLLLPPRYYQFKSSLVRICHAQFSPQALASTSHEKLRMYEDDSDERLRIDDNDDI
ncbi:hypothetical protein NMY22_g15821 [Coprinellus aureogranulatus]|nr:hypothetical protein NMY22_g15821 [Coprinellus aureogranulatus]